jgi:hypothetical protein
VRARPRGVASTPGQRCLWALVTPTFVVPHSKPARVTIGWEVLLRPKGEKRQFSIRLDALILEKVRALAEVERRSVASMIDVLLEEAMSARVKRAEKDGGAA